MAVTIKDIANKVGKSVTTVSRALAGYDDVSPETRKRVWKLRKSWVTNPILPLAGFRNAARIP
jgi:hypothetical protein